MAGKAIVDYKAAVKERREANTAKEMVESWKALIPPGVVTPEEFREFSQGQVGVYVEKAPGIIKYLCHDAALYSMEEGAMDPKTRELVIIGALAALKSGDGLSGHIPYAIGQGATEEEIMDAIYCGIEKNAKVAACSIGAGVKRGLELAAKAKVEV